MSLLPIAPLVGLTQSLTVTSSSSSVTFTTPGIAAQSVRVANTGANIAFVRWGVGAQTAVSTTDTPILPNAVETFSKGLADTFAAITAAAGTTLYVTPGDGV